jgi:hypothetical protein
MFCLAAAGRNEGTLVATSQLLLYSRLSTGNAPSFTLMQPNFHKE